MLSAYDAAPPVVAAPTVTGNLFAGAPLTLATTATDAWSTAGTPTWTFGDGSARQRARASRTPTRAAGTYTAHVSVTDASGNTAGADVTVVVANAQATLASARFSGQVEAEPRHAARWSSRARRPVAGTYALDVLKGTTRKFHFSVKLAAAAVLAHDPAAGASSSRAPIASRSCRSATFVKSRDARRRRSRRRAEGVVDVKR